MGIEHWRGYAGEEEVLSKYTPEACARAGIPYDPEWREIIPDKGYSKMQFWETTYQNVLLVEEPVHARKERGIYEHAYARSLVAIPNPDGTVTHLTPEYWRHEWRSMPDYDGPPMRAPSGVRVSIGTGPSDLIFSSALYPPKKKGELPRMVYTKIAITSPWTEVDPSLDDYAHPSAGGRGWCPKLVGVKE